MQVNLYLSLLPEALVFSMLSPAEYGRYLALGAERRTRGQVIFFEVDPEPLREHFDLENLIERCKPHPDGRPHRSSYVSIYRVLEFIPVSALRKLYLVTRDGASLSISRGERAPTSSGALHLYQELCPVTPRVVSRLGPTEFVQFMTQPSQPLSVPRIIFAEMGLGALANDPNHPGADLPYRNMQQLRYCLNEMQKRPEKQTKIVDRELQRDLPYWMISGGIYAGDTSGLAFFPVPSEDELRSSHYSWWSSAQAVELM